MTGFIRPASFSRRNGKTSPAKLDPPPVQPTIRSGPASPASSNCASASWPITVWCSSTWLRTEPSAYRVSADPPAASTASLIAMPSEPVESGLGGPGRGRVHGRAVGLHKRAPVRLLVVGRPDHPDLAVEGVLRRRERERAAPLPGAGLGG